MDRNILTLFFSKHKFGSRVWGFLACDLHSLPEPGMIYSAASPDGWAAVPGSTGLAVSSVSYGLVVPCQR